MREEEILSRFRRLTEKISTLEYHVSRLEGDLQKVKSAQGRQRRW